jgi:hypothetical protein
MTLLDQPCRLPPRHNRGAVVIWLAFFALLSNVLLPARLLVAAGMLKADRDTIGSTLCSAASGRDLPGKAEPELPLHHCALCTVPAGELSRPQTGSVLRHEVAGASHPLLRSVSAAAPLRHGRVQARAPPVMA